MTTTKKDLDDFLIPSKRYRDVVATIWDEKELEEFTKFCDKFYICGKEVCPTTGRIHWQSFGQWTKQTRGSQLWKMFPTTNLRRKKGSVEDNIIYCSKHKDKSDILMSGEASYSGKRTDLMTVKTMTKEGKSVREIIENLDRPNFQTIRCAEIMRRYIFPKRKKLPTIIWIYGSTGVGKTRFAIETAEEAKMDYWMSNGTLEWWDGYDCHPIAILDDFRGNQCTFTKFLRYLDRYETSVPIKGCFMPLIAETIFITSAYKPEDVYKSENVNENIEQLIRRCTFIIGFGLDRRKFDKGTEDDFNAFIHMLKISSPPSDES